METRGAALIPGHPGTCQLLIPQGVQSQLPHLPRILPIPTRTKGLTLMICPGQTKASKRASEQPEQRGLEAAEGPFHPLFTFSYETHRRHLASAPATSQDLRCSEFSLFPCLLANVACESDHFPRDASLPLAWEQLQPPTPLLAPEPFSPAGRVNPSKCKQDHLVPPPFPPQLNLSNCFLACLE